LGVERCAANRQNGRVKWLLPFSPRPRHILAADFSSKVERLDPALDELKAASW
jgi:hypothetical protein